jgi:hypothetical protein
MANWRGIFLLASSSVNNSVTMLLPNRYPQTRRLVARGAYACFLVFSSMHDPSFAGKEVSMTGVCQSGNQLHALADSLSRSNHQDNSSPTHKPGNVPNRKPLRHNRSFLQSPHSSGYSSAFEFRCHQSSML